MPHFDRVHLLAPGTPGATEHEEINGVFIHRFSYAWPASLQKLCYRKGIMQNIRANPLLLSLLPGFLIAQKRAIRKLCTEHPITTLNSHWLIFQSLIAGPICKAKGIKHVPHSHGASIYMLKRLYPGIGRALTRRILKNSNNIICESTYVRSKLDSLLDAPSGAIVSCMGVDISNFSRSTKTKKNKKILFVGRLVEKKGVEYLLRAMQLLENSEPEAQLIIAGGGALENDLKKLANQLGLDKSKANFLGPVPHNKIPKLLEESRVFAVPSIIDSHGEADGMPTVLVEAMATKCLIVASDVNGIPDLLHHEKNGWLCQPEDPHDLAAKLRLALTYNETAIPDAARKTAEHYDWSALGSRYARMLKTDISRQPYVSEQNQSKTHSSQREKS